MELHKLKPKDGEQEEEDLIDSNVDEEDVGFSDFSNKITKQAKIERKQTLLRRVFIVIGIIIAVLAVVLLVWALVKESKDQTNQTNGRWSSPRLPPYVVPIHYDMRITADMTNFNFSTESTIQIMVNESTEVIVMNMKLLNVKSAALTRADGQRVLASNISTNETLEYIYFSFMELPIWFEEGDRNFNLSLEFFGDMRDTIRGFYKSSYQENGQTYYLASTDFEPMEARSAFICFDEPAMKATWKLTLVIDPEYTALSNMPEEVSSMVGGKLEVQFQKSVKMSSYLVCFIISKFAFVSGTIGPVQVRIFTTPGTVSYADYALEVAKNSLSVFQDYFGIAYPLPKLDLIGLPDYEAGAMENWGLITFRQALLLFNQNESSVYDIQNIVGVVAHEIGHQWFGNLVTMQWWSDLWLNEGFATFLEFLGPDAMYPDWELWNQYVGVKQEALYLDSLNSSHPVATPEDFPAEEIIQQFDAISYSKGGSIIKMLEDYVIRQSGDPKAFSKGLTSYLNAHLYSNAKTADLWSALSESSGIPEIPTMMNTWTNQMGYPILNVTYNSTSGQMHVTQRRFLLVPDDNAEVIDPSTFWYVPLVMSTQNGRIVDMTLRQTETTTTNYHPNIDGFAYLDNGNGNGFYRVHYYGELLDLLTQRLKTAHEDIPIRVRSSIINDYFNFLQSGHVSIEDALRTVEYLSSERDISVWSTALGSLNGISMIFRTESYYGLFEEFMRSLLEPTINSTSWNISPQDDHVTRIRRAGIISSAAVFRHVPTVNTLISMFNQFMANPTTYFLHPDLRSVVYTIGMQYGDEPEYEFLLQRYNQTTLNAEKTRILRALCSASQPYLLKRTLELSLDRSTIKSQDTGSVIAYVANNQYGTDIAWEFFRENIDTLIERFGGSFSIGGMISNIAGHFNSLTKYREVEDFAAEHDLPGASRAVNQVLEIIDSNIKWLSLNGDSLQQWLSNWKNSQSL